MAKPRRSKAFEKAEAYMKKHPRATSAEVAAACNVTWQAAACVRRARRASTAKPKRKYTRRKISDGASPTDDTDRLKMKNQRLVALVHTLMALITED